MYVSMRRRSAHLIAYTWWTIGGRPLSLVSGTSREIPYEGRILALASSWLISPERVSSQVLAIVPVIPKTNAVLQKCGVTMIAATVQTISFPAAEKLTYLWRRCIDESGLERRSPYSNSHRHGKFGARRSLKGEQGSL
jgi:hypothetical protein